MNRAEIKEKALKFAQGWWDSIGDYWEFHFATFVLGGICFLIAYGLS